MNEKKNNWKNPEQSIKKGKKLKEPDLGVFDCENGDKEI